MILASLLGESSPMRHIPPTKVSSSEMRVSTLARHSSRRSGLAARRFLARFKCLSLNCFKSSFTLSSCCASASSARSQSSLVTLARAETTTSGFSLSLPFTIEITLPIASSFWTDVPPNLMIIISLKILSSLYCFFSHSLENLDVLLNRFLQVGDEDIFLVRVGGQDRSGTAYSPAGELLEPWGVTTERYWF